MSATAELIAFAQELDYGLLPGEVIVQARRCVLDLLGVAIAGSRTRMAEVSTTFARGQFGSGSATLIGSHLQLSEAGASWVNGICASALDMDDGHRRAMGHPGAAVIPTALAVAETSAASGRDFLTALIAGYEVAVRVSMSMLPEYRAGRYSTGIWGGLGSATAAARLLKLDAKGFQNALGIVVAHGPSPPGGDFLHDSMVKEVIAWAGLTGCAAALLARDGFAGPQDVLDKARRYATDRLTMDLGREYAILGTYFKPYASCRWSHPAIDAALSLVHENGLRLEEIAEIQVAGFGPITMLVDYTPVSTVAAQYSIPFSLALALRHGRIGPAELSEDHLHQPELLELARRVRISVDPALDQLFPEKTAMRVTLRTSRGDLARTVEHPKGDPANPLSGAELAEKFQWLSVELAGEKRSRQIQAAVEHLEELPDIRELTRLLAF